MFTSVPDIAIVAAARHRTLLDEAADHRLAREARRARRKERRQAAAAETVERLPSSTSSERNCRASVPP